MKFWLRSGLVGGVTGGLRAEGLGWGLRVERVCVKEKRLRKRGKRLFYEKKKAQKNARRVIPPGAPLRGPPEAVPAGGWKNTGLGHFKDSRLRRGPPFPNAKGDGE